MPNALRRLGLRRGDVAAACRRQGADAISEIKEATLSPGGAIVVTLADDHRDVTVADLRAEHTELVAAIRGELAAAVSELEHRLGAPGTGAPGTPA